LKERVDREPWPKEGKHMATGFERERSLSEFRKKD